MSRPSSRAAAAFLLALTLAGAPFVCHAAPPSPGEAESKAPVAPAAANVPAVEVPGAPQALVPGGLLVPGSEFRYDATGRRDPFKSLLELEKKQRDLSQLPLIQQIDLETLRVVGVVVDPSRGAQAMVKAPNGRTFVVRVGTIIGKNEGEVVNITLEGIHILEKFLDFMNRETRKETFLKSHPTAGK